MLYRGDEAGMSGYHHEWYAARVASARAIWHALPVAYEGDGRVQRVRYARLDAQKKPTGEEATLDADLVLLAIGQARLGDLVADVKGIRLDGGRIVVDANGFTGRPGWYAGGDCANGGKEVVNAAAEGKAAARAIDAWLATAKKEASLHA
jgi:glutamate synthase (NADPH/NADH) small chain